MSKINKAKTLLKGRCWHEIVRRSRAPSSDGPDGARCVNCGDWGEIGQDFGWYCEDSPDHLCHYFSTYDYDKRRCSVKSVNGEVIYLSKKHTRSKIQESRDWCIFCGEPEERK